MNNIKLDSNKNNRTQKLPFSINLPIVVIPEEPLLGKQVFRAWCIQIYSQDTLLKYSLQNYLSSEEGAVDCRCNCCIPTDEMPNELLLLASAAALVRNWGYLIHSKEFTSAAPTQISRQLMETSKGQEYPLQAPIQLLRTKRHRLNYMLLEMLSRGNMASLVSTK